LLIMSAKIVRMTILLSFAGSGNLRVYLENCRGSRKSISISCQVVAFCKPGEKLLSNYLIQVNSIT